jgi:RNA polymerase sigma-70 factor (ECF subfamily)
MGSVLVEAKRIEFDDAARENLQMNRGARTVEDEAEGRHVEIENPPTPGQLILDEFDAIHAKYYRRVYRQCFRMVRNQEDAEDLTQEVFLLLYRKAHTFRGEANFSTWLHRLTINTVLMKLRSHRRWRESVSSLDVVPGPDRDLNETATLASAIPAPPASTVEKISLDVALSQLSGGYREVFLLHDSEGYRHDEIAQILGISEGTSKSQLHKARFRLRKLVESGNIRRLKFAPAEVGTDEAESDVGCVPSTKVIPAGRRSGSIQHRKRISHKAHVHRAAA